MQVNDVLSMSLLETGKVTMETEHFNLREAVQATMKMVSLPDSALGKRFIAKLNDLPTEEVEGDRKKLTQVLLNLVRILHSRTRERLTDSTDV